MPQNFGEVLLRVYTKDVRSVLHLIGYLEELFSGTPDSSVLSRQATALYPPALKWKVPNPMV